MRGRTRLFVFLLMVFGVGSLGLYWFGDLKTDDIVLGWKAHHSYFKLVPEFLLKTVVLFGRGLRYYSLVIVAFLTAFLIAARYLQSVYKLRGFDQAVRYLVALLFAFNYPRLTIEEGDVENASGESNLLMEIGGPGYLNVQSGNVVLLEHVGGVPRVCSMGVNFVTRREKIRKIIRLEDRHGYIESVETFTKDGIRVRVRDLHYRYRLQTGRNISERARQRQDDPNQFSIRAVLNMVYQRSVRSNGVTPWHQLVNIAVDAAVTDYIRSHRFDKIATPRFDDKDPREEIAQKLYTNIRNRLAGVGAELLWADMGHFEAIDRRVDEQFAETWGAKWLGIAKVKRAYGEAKRISYLELGRAEAQAEMLLSIIDALEDVEKTEDNVRAIVLSRTAQILDGLADSGLLPSGEYDELLPPW